MPDLHERLTAAVNARLEVARAATPGPWTRESNRSITASVGAKRYVMPSIGASEPWPSDADADHIALHDPADAIRRYERDLLVLERHAPVHIGGPAACKHAWADSDGWIEDYPCDEIRDLAAAYGVEVVDV